MKVLPFKIPVTKGESFRVQIDDETHFYDTFHKHPEVQVMYIEQGEGTLICGEYVGNFYPGDVIVAGPDQPHVFRNNKEYYEAGSGLRAKAISIYFGQESFGSSFFNLPEMDVIANFLYKSKRGLKFEKEMAGELAGMIKNMTSTTGVERFILLLRLLQRMSETNNFSYLSSEAELNIYDEKEGKRMNKIYAFTMEEFYRQISLEEVADLANMTPNAFCRYFKQRTRKTYVGFLNEIRISNACKLLKNKELTVAQICYQSGFNNLSHFNRNFKKVKGMAPSEYQKILQLD